MLNKMDLNRIKTLVVRDDLYSVLQRLAQDMIEECHRDLPTGKTEFEYLRQALERDGKIMGIDWFLRRMEEIANKT